MSLGSLMLDVAGLELTEIERERLRHPLVGGVILFSRNYAAPEQVEALIHEIHAVRGTDDPKLLVAVDQEGGRVQRFRDGFTELPPVRNLGELYDENRKRAKRLAEASGWLMATELRAIDVDISFAPVLDIDLGVSAVIGDRAFHANPEVVADLAHSYMNGMSRAGMAATGKHFPGHGSVAPDSHEELPIDNREYEDVHLLDLVPFERMIHFGLPAVMAAHILFPKIDRLAVGFSSFWLKEVLRNRLGFQGAIFSDDLSMKGAAVMGDMPERARAALTAGCDMVLVCNDPEAVDQVLDQLSPDNDPVSHLRLARLHGRHPVDRTRLALSDEYRQAVHMVLNTV
jgi:beta-N-acetylhexosaminidase